MNKRIVITGMGAVTSIGIGVDAYWKELLAGKCGIKEIPDTHSNYEHYPVRKAGCIEGFIAKELLPKHLALDLEPFQQYAYVAAEEAIKMSGITFADPARTGLVMGSALNGLIMMGDTQEALAVNGKKVGPKFLPKVMGNMAAAHLAIQYQIKGPCLSVSTACASGGDAVMMAALLMNAGACDSTIVMAGEASLSATLVQSLYKGGALSKTGNSRPFDAGRDGFVAGEGGGALVLETLESAKARGAVILAELMGCGNNTDAYNPVAPDPEGHGAAACMALALKDAGLDPSEIGYINAHGTATAAGDVAECKAIHAVFGDTQMPVSSIKGSVGHLMGAGGITELIACIKAINEGILPANVGCDELDPAVDLNIIKGQPLKCEIKYAMSNAFGFGGQNSSVIVGRY